MLGHRAGHRRAHHGDVGDERLREGDPRAHPRRRRPHPDPRAGDAGSPTGRRVAGEREARPRGVGRRALRAGAGPALHRARRCAASSCAASCPSSRTRSPTSARTCSAGQPRGPAGRASSASCWASASRGRCALDVGDRVTLISPQGQVTPAGLMPRLKQFTRGRHLRARPQRVRLGAGARAHGGRAGALPHGRRGERRAPEGARHRPRAARWPASSRATLPREAYVTDWTQQNVNYFRAVQIEKRMMFIILTLIIAVAAFNLVSTLVMVVTDKHPGHRDPAHARRLARRAS